MKMDETIVTLSRLKPVEIRCIWNHEAGNFTPWLAENIDELGEVLGLDLEDVQTEVSVGPFFLDVLARDSGSDRVVVIENQLENTDHDHLGKLLTYAAFFKAHVIVWIARDFRPEHRAVFDWLNDRMDEQNAFFAIRVEAWKIGNSDPAPRLVPVVSPNEWERQTQTKDDLTGRPLRYRNFFKTLIDELRDQHQFTNARQGTTSNWYNFASGVSGIHYQLAFVKENRVVVGLNINTGNKRRNELIVDKLASRNISMPPEIGSNVKWEHRPNIQASFVHSLRTGSIDEGEDQLESIRAWAIEHLLAYKSAFGSHIKAVLAESNELEGSPVDEGME